MATKWTKEQRNAITANNGSVLVSAAAGSGKTSVLIQRVIEKITSKTNPINVDQFLIVTFTNAAANEMKARLSDKLSQMIAENPSDLNLHRQQMLLKSTDIGTIHSFCKALLQENFFKLGISPKIKIISENEGAVINADAMQETLNHFFEEQNKEFILLADNLTNEKSTSKLEELIEKFYQFTRSLPFPEKWMDEKLKLYEQALCGNDIWETEIKKNIAAILSEVLQSYQSAMNVATKDEILKQNYSKIYAQDMAELENLQKILPNKNIYEFNQMVQGFKFEHLPTIKSKELDENLKNIFIQKREYAKKAFENLKSSANFTPEETEKAISSTIKMVKALFEVTKYYSNKIQDIKMLKNCCDFNDLEHFTLKLLVDETADDLQKSDFAKKIGEKYTEIMVDEYQDINETQDTIFKMISKNETNLFMVGDVKQSIYKFRNAKPQIFLKKKQEYHPYTGLSSAYPAKISLGKNFRSQEGIINNINFIFKNLMTKEMGEIEYNGEEELIYGGTNPSAPSEQNVSFKIIDITSSKGTDDDKDVIEARYIAKTILKMISENYPVNDHGTKRPITFSDFCILLKNSNDHAHIYAQELTKCAVPTWSEAKEEFLKSKEISTVLSLLEIINNPTNDVAFAATMLSPFFGFSTDDLVSIRLAENNVPLYFAAKKYAESTKDEKVNNFLNKLGFYRMISAGMPCDEFIDYLYSDTHYPAICSALPNGERKKANLFMLINYAKQFETRTSEGLTGFLNFIKKTKAQKNDFAPAKISSKSENTVQIMSIHKSKGLEFPVCIVAGCSKRKKTDTLPFVIDNELGVGINLKGESGKNLITTAISIKQEKETISEILRLLYVALTRAKQKLILISSLENPDKQIDNALIMAEQSAKPSPYYVQKTSSFTKWLLMCLAHSNLKNKLCKLANLPMSEPSTNSSYIKNFDVEIISPKTDETEEEAEKPQTNYLESKTTVNSEISNLIQAKFSEKYPHENAINLPVKLSASQFAKGDAWKHFIGSSRPNFASKNNLSAANLGTAMHNFVCNANFIDLAKGNLDHQIDILVNKKFITPEEAAALNKKALENFIQSNIFNRMLKSTNVLKEYRFTVSIPAKIIYPEAKIDASEKIIVQGAIDCAFEETDGYVIIDYKTDKIENMQELFEKYYKQLTVYKYALEKVTGKKVKEIGIYSFYNSEYLSIS